MLLRIRILAIGSGGAAVLCAGKAWTEMKASFRHICEDENIPTRGRTLNSTQQLNASMRHTGHTRAHAYTYEEHTNNEYVHTYVMTTHA